MSFEENQLRRMGLKVGRIRGIEVWLHWWLLAFFALELVNTMFTKPPLPFGFQRWVLSSGALLLAVLCHELGHCYAAFRQGGGAERVVLWPLGGFAYCDAPHEPRAQLLTAAGGIVVNSLLALISGAVCLAAGWSLLPLTFDDPSLPYARAFCQYFFLWNAFPLIVNLMPCYPLDGGRMLQACVWEKVESFGQATLVALRVGQVFAIFGLVAGVMILAVGFFDHEFKYAHPLLWQLGFGFTLMAWMHFAEAKRLFHRLRSGEEEDDGIFGYDFSRGYTSLEKTAVRKERKSLVAALKERFSERTRAQRKQREAGVRQRLDEILTKIHEQGMESLSRHEQRFLKKASKILRK